MANVTKFNRSVDHYVEEIKDKRYTEYIADKQIKIVSTGNYEIKKISISTNLLNPDNGENLELLLATVINNLITKIQKDRVEKIKILSGLIDLDKKQKG